MSSGITPLLRLQDTSLIQNPALVNCAEGLVEAERGPAVIDARQTIPYGKFDLKKAHLVLGLLVELLERAGVRSRREHPRYEGASPQK